MSQVRELMTYESVKNGLGRWVKRHEQRRYRIGIRELAEQFPEIVDAQTRAGTRRAANEWWQSKLRDLDTEKNQPAVKLATIVRDFQKSLRNQAIVSRDSTLLAEIDQRIRRLETLIETREAIPGLQLREATGAEESEIELVSVVDGLDTATIAKQTLRETLRKESAKFDAVLPVILPECGTVVSEDRSLSGVVKTWLADREAAVRRKPVNGTRELSSGRFVELRTHMRDLESYAPPGSAIDSVNNASTLTRYREKLLAETEAEKISLETARRRLGALKQLLRWAFEQEIIDALPRNISAASLAITVDRKEPVLFDLETFRKIVAAAPERTQLFLLLMVNCGFRQCDLSDLRLREVDFRAGRIRHARVKTRKENPPVVNYLLWEETAELLRKHVTNETRPLIPDSTVFANENGGPLVSRTIDTKGVEKCSDCVNSAYWRVLRKLEIKGSAYRSLGGLRTTSANLLRKKFGGEIQSLFLGHNPRDTATRFYTTTHDDTRLDQPLTWLRGEYGLPLAVSHS